MSRPLSYNTPGRECAHADKGCCPTCLDPMAPLPCGSPLDVWVKARMSASPLLNLRTAA